MKAGGWVPLSKYLSLPKNREYSEVEAAYSLQRDYDEGNPVTVAGYAALWGWSRGKVERFLDALGLVIHYPADTGKKQNQRGQIMIQIASRSRAENGQKRIIDSKWLDNCASRSRADNEQKTSRSQGTTIDPDPNPDPKEKRFVPPTLEEVVAYCLERQRGVDPQRWLDYYQSKGWMIGKNRMKDWRAAVRTWEENGRRGGNGGPRRLPVTGDGHRDSGITEDGRF